MEGLIKQYNNGLTPEILASFDTPAFSDGQVAGMSQEWQEPIAKQKTELKQHPVIEIYRIAVEGAKSVNKLY